MKSRLTLLMFALPIITGCATSPIPANFTDVGILALYGADEFSAESSLPILESLGCDIWREGPMRPQGEMKLGMVDRYAFADCDGPVLDKESNRIALNQAFRSNDTGIILEGHFVRKETEFADSDAAKSRGYLVKISRFNNLHPVCQSEEDKIDAEGAKRPDSWKSEARIRVYDSIGMDTPDEVGLIYYKTPESMSAFVEASPDLVDDITAFNQRHLLESSYLWIEVE